MRPIFCLLFSFFPLRENLSSGTAYAFLSQLKPVLRTQQRSSLHGNSLPLCQGNDTFREHVAT